MKRIRCINCDGTGDKRVTGFYSLGKCARCNGWGFVTGTPLNILRNAWRVRKSDDFRRTWAAPDARFLHEIAASKYESRARQIRFVAIEFLASRIRRIDQLFKLAMQTPEYALSLEKELLYRNEQKKWLGGDAFVKAWDASADPQAMIWLAARYGVSRETLYKAVRDILYPLVVRADVREDAAIRTAYHTFTAWLAGTATIETLRTVREAAYLCAMQEKDRDISERDRAALKSIALACVCATDYEDPIAVASTLSNVIKGALAAWPRMERAERAAEFAERIRFEVTGGALVRSAIDHAAINEAEVA